MPIVSLTFDSCGTKRLERLPSDELRYAGRGLDNTAFVVRKGRYFEGITVLFKITHSFSNSMIL